MTHEQAKIEERFLTLEDAGIMADSGLLPGNMYVKATSVLRDDAFWRHWAIRALLALAVGHILSGIIFFFAFNWDDWPAMAKFWTVGGGIASCLIAWIAAKLDSPIGQAFGVGATVLVGVMFAVLGQVYQTPAMIHTPFVLWSLLTLPFALASRNLAHWAVWLVISTVAVTAYANSGLRLAGNDSSANALNLAVSAGLITALIFVDKVISPRCSWARAEWFRVLLVLGASGFILLGFTESFWGSGNGLWALAIVLSGGVLAYLYYLKPSLGALSIASFCLFALIAQFGFKFGFKVVDIGRETIAILLMMFVWLGGLTLGLVSLFRHFIKRFKMDENFDFEDEAEVSSESGITVPQFNKYMDIEENVVIEALLNGQERDHPWYMAVILAIAGIFTAVLGCAFFGFFIALILGDSDEYAFAVLGLVIFGVSMTLRRQTDSPYVQHILNTLIIVGGVLTAVGLGLTIGNKHVIVAVTLALSSAVLILVRDRILEFLSALAIVILIGAEFYLLKIPMVESFVLFISTALGVIALTRPIGKRLYKAAGSAFLLVPAVFGIAMAGRYSGLYTDGALQLSDNWLTRMISLVILLGAVCYLNRGKGIVDFKPPVLVLIPLLIGAAIVPLGGASALLVILAGYILGSRSLAIVGTLIQIYFLYAFYYDLALGLLAKSIVLFLSGVIFLGVWYFVNRNREASA